MFTYKLGQIILQVYYLLSKINFSKVSSNILIIKNDSIGDYIIFHNFINLIVQSPQYSLFQVNVLVNERVYPIANALNANNNYKIIEVKDNRTDTIFSQIKFYNIFNRLKSHTIILPLYSPDVFSLNLFKFITAKNKISIDNNWLNIPAYQIKRYNYIATKVISTTNDLIHEFERNKLFISKVINQKLDIIKPTIYINKNASIAPYILFCPGAQHQSRIWSPINISRLINLLNEYDDQLNYYIAVIPSEQHLYNEVISNLSNSVKGKVSNYSIKGFMDYCQFIVNSKLVICNDSAAVHISVALNAKTICISNANYYGRFVPYPNSVENFQVIISEEAKLEISKNSRSFINGSDLNINSINPQDVLPYCKRYLS